MKKEFLRWFMGRFYGDDSMTTENYDEIIDKVEEIGSQSIVKGKSQ